MNPGSFDPQEKRQLKDWFAQTRTWLNIN